MNWYERKAAEFFDKWETATEAGDEVTAQKAMTEHLNYSDKAQQNKELV